MSLSAPPNRIGRTKRFIKSSENRADMDRGLLPIAPRTQYIIMKLAERGYNITPDAAEELSKLHHEDLDRAIPKICKVAKGPVITLNDVRRALNSWRPNKPKKRNYRKSALEKEFLLRLEMFKQEIDSLRELVETFTRDNSLRQNESLP